MTNLLLAMLDKVGVPTRDARRQHRPARHRAADASSVERHVLRSRLRSRSALLLARAAAGATPGAAARRREERRRDGARGRCSSERVDVNDADADGTTALHWAVQRDDADARRARCSSAGADARPRNRYGVTPLYLAADNGNAAMVETLLERGADPNTALPEGETALMTAARTGDVATLRGAARARRRRRTRRKAGRARRR